MTSSGESTLLTGKPWPPACCQRVCAAHPPETSNREPVVSTLSEGWDKSQTCVERSAGRQTFANEIADNRRDEVGLRKSSACVRPGFLECLTLKASTISCGLETSEGFTRRLAYANLPDGLSHCSASRGSQNISENVIFHSLDGDGSSEPYYGSFGRRVICLTKIAV
jgi:hypothetical protein